MSIVLLGGHERMKNDYKKICKEYGYKVKMFSHYKTNLYERIGSPDYIVILSNTISHKAAILATKACSKRNIDVIKMNNSSAKALRETIKDLSC
ncbi:DUF2325 domain-containing protein [Clostridium sediminicola]|uniref:DUF2325 domain-containing protein n=1 Tax=Clostridium sediminicola TaxID=3114879 RepID=UPI003D17B124